MERRPHINYGQEWFEVGSQLRIAETLARLGFEVKADTDLDSGRRAFFARVAQ